MPPPLAHGLQFLICWGSLNWGWYAGRRENAFFEYRTERLLFTVMWWDATLQQHTAKKAKRSDCAFKRPQKVERKRCIFNVGHRQVRLLPECRLLTRKAAEPQLHSSRALPAFRSHLTFAWSFSVPEQRLQISSRNNIWPGGSRLLTALRAGLCVIP